MHKVIYLPQGIFQIHLHNHIQCIYYQYTHTVKDIAPDDSNLFQVVADNNVHKNTIDAQDSLNSLRRDHHQVRKHFLCTCNLQGISCPFHK